MKVVLTVKLQTDANADVVVGTQTLSSFTGADVQTAINFLKGGKMQDFVQMLGWRADTKFTYVGEPITLTIGQL